MTRHRSRRNTLARVTVDACGPYLTDVSPRGALVLAAMLIEADEAWQRGDRARRIQSAAREKRAAGNWYAGTPPYGWRTAGLGRLEPVAVELQVIEWILRQREQGYGWHAITERLNDANTPGPAGGPWHSSTVRRIVARGTANPALRAEVAADGDRGAGEG